MSETAVSGAAGATDGFGSKGVIVVGVDGSDGSKLALRWAADEARLRGVKVLAVAAWEFPYVYAGPGDMVPLLPWKDQAPEMLQVLDHEITEVLGGTDGTGGTGGVVVETSVEEGPPATVLLEAAKEADLLVVGSRGRGGFSGLLLGSVSTQCAHHAPCPVVIVPHPAK